jgi:hypothetical protein
MPLLLILGTLAVAGDKAVRILGSGRAFLQRHWPVLLAGVGVLAGVFVILLGAMGFASTAHGRFGRFARHLRHFLKP